MSRTDRPDSDSGEGGNPVLDFRRRFALWNNLSFWRQWALGASLAALAFLAVIVLDTPSAPGYVAVLRSGHEGPAWLVTANTTEGVLTIRPLGASNAGGRAYELWTIPEESTPLSLGTVQVSGETAIPLDIGLARRIADAGALAIVPEGESPASASNRPMYRGQLLSLAR